MLELLVRKFTLGRACGDRDIAERIAKLVHPVVTLRAKPIGWMADVFSAVGFDAAGTGSWRWHRIAHLIVPGLRDSRLF